jgi:hypothetical protein
MTFEEIFQTPGLYKAESFAEGVCFEVKENSITNDKELYTVTYKDKNDIIPEKVPTLVYAGLFKKEYKKVFTRQSIFKL